MNQVLTNGWVSTQSTRMKMPRELEIGDQIVTGSRGPRLLTEKVTQVEHYACSGRNTHVNSSACYPWSVAVEVLA